MIMSNVSVVSIRYLCASPMISSILGWLATASPPHSGMYLFCVCNVSVCVLSVDVEVLCMRKRSEGVNGVLSVFVRPEDYK